MFCLAMISCAKHGSSADYLLHYSGLGPSPLPPGCANGVSDRWPSIGAARGPGLLLPLLPVMPSQGLLPTGLALPGFPPSGTSGVGSSQPPSTQMSAKLAGANPKDMTVNALSIIILRLFILLPFAPLNASKIRWTCPIVIQTT